MTPYEILDGIEIVAGFVFMAVFDEEELRQTVSMFMGPGGSLTTILKLMPTLPPAERKTFGIRINEVKTYVTSQRDNVLAHLVVIKRERELHDPATYDPLWDPKKPSQWVWDGTLTPKSVGWEFFQKD
jgi:phenylalanyl-tRNA synthetase alpha chain